MADTAITLRVLDRINEVPQASWDAMLGPESSPFVEHTWLDMLEQTGCVGKGTGWRAAHLSLWRGEKLIAVAPSYAKGNSEGEFVFDWGWADLAQKLGLPYYPKVIIAVPFTPATGDRVLVAPGEDRVAAERHIADGARAWCRRLPCSGVHVLFPRHEGPGPTAWEASGYLPRFGFQFHWFREGATTFDDYLARFSSKQRNQIKREIRTIADRGITVETLTPEGHTHDVANTMYTFYGTTVDKHGHWGRHYLNEAFFHMAVDRFRDRLSWVVAKDAQGDIIAGAFNVSRGKRLYGRYWGTTVDVPNLHFVVCFYAGIKHAIEHGLDVFEPGAGGEHKLVRGFIPTLTRSYHWLEHARMRAIIAPWLERERTRVLQILDGKAEAEND